jgi:ectoine hydroxylase-related dioxygenase (phytanoyl-CoA dioxygenase family)
MFDDCSTLQNCDGHGKKGFQECMKHRWWENNKSSKPENAELRQLLGKFVDEVIAPLLWAEEEESNESAHTQSDRSLGGVHQVYYQDKPTLRVHMPGQSHVCTRHRDYSYKRQPTEINVWLPLTAVGGTNSLWVESEPGCEDFTPFETNGFGEAVLFWGNQCEHYTVQNTTDTTRVSLDFRVVRSDLYVPAYTAPAHRRRFGSKAKPNVSLGCGYTSTARENTWRQEQEQQEKEQEQQEPVQEQEQEQQEQQQQEEEQQQEQGQGLASTSLGDQRRC